MRTQLGKELAQVYSKSALEQIANHAEMAANLCQEKAKENFKESKKVDMNSINDGIDYRNLFWILKDIIKDLD